MLFCCQRRILQYIKPNFLELTTHCICHHQGMTQLKNFTSQSGRFRMLPAKTKFTSQSGSQILNVTIQITNISANKYVTGKYNKQNKSYLIKIIRNYFQ